MHDEDDRCNLHSRRFHLNVHRPAAIMVYISLDIRARGLAANSYRFAPLSSFTTTKKSRHTSHSHRSGRPQSKAEARAPEAAGGALADGDAAYEEVTPVQVAVLKFHRSFRNRQRQHRLHIVDPGRKDSSDPWLCILTLGKPSSNCALYPLK